jgi:hypothetical protein
MYSVLKEDVIKCVNKALEEGLTEQDEQFWRRMIVRSTFSYIEGVTYRMKQQAYEAHQVFEKYKDHPATNFTSAELAFMVEEDHELNDKGEIVTVRAKIPITKSIRLAFKVYARANFCDYELATGDHRWDSFKKGLKIRDRLMHPKNVHDLTVTDDDFDILIDTITWFEQNIKGLFQATLTGIANYNNLLGEERVRLLKEIAEAKLKEMIDQGLVTSENDDIANSIKDLTTKDQK